MSRQRLGLFLAAAILAGLWSAQTLIAHVVRLANQPTLQAIRKGETAPSHSMLKGAISGYETAMVWTPCNAALQADMSLLLAQHADAAMAQTDAAQGDAALENMQHAVLERLACTPRDGKAWLDLAMLDVFREGAGAASFTAYRMSAQAAPREGWLAKKRLEFALTFLPILTAEELTVARADLAVLEHAHPNNLLAVQAAAKVENKQALYALFGATMPVEAP